MANIDELLNSLSGIKSRGQDRWTALCPVHNEKSASLSIRLIDNDSIICHCFGCGANGVDVANALGLDLAVLFPEREHKRQRTPFPAADILKALYNEVLVFSIFAGDLKKGKKISDVDYERAMKAASRIIEAVHYAK